MYGLDDIYHLHFDTFGNKFLLPCQTIWNQWAQIPGQFWTPHCSVSVVLPVHGAPPFVGGIHARVRFRWPSQVAEHWPQYPQSLSTPSTVVTEITTRIDFISLLVGRWSLMCCCFFNFVYVKIFKINSIECFSLELKNSSCFRVKWFLDNTLDLISQKTCFFTTSPYSFQRYSTRLSQNRKKKELHCSWYHSNNYSFWLVFSPF